MSRVSWWGQRGGVVPSRIWTLAGLTAASALFTAIAAAPYAVAAPVAHAGAPAASPGTAVTGLTQVLPRKIPVHNDATRRFVATHTAWPSAATATLSLSSPSTSSTPEAKARSSAVPVWAQAVNPAEGKYAGPSSLGVKVLSHSQAGSLGVNGVAFTVDGGDADRGSVRVGLDYAAFAQGYGGNYASRLHLVELPACALTTPQVAACRTQTPLPTSVDYSAQSVSTVVGLGTPTAAQSTGQTRQPTHIMAPKSMVLAATASAGTDGSAAGSYAATSLKPSGSWSQGGDSGSFTYTYPVTLPAASTSLAPSVSLAYDSGSVDGQTSMTAAQSSWIGDGWSSPDSYIEQTFATCSDNPEGSAAPVSTSDACYDGPILTVSLNGSSTALVCNTAETSCTPADDNGETVQHVTSSGNGTKTYNTDYWIITERNGTKYEFGRNQLPGWASGKAATNSVDYEPVFSAHSGDPCYNATWSSSVCTMAYRWHLDYVVDTHSQAMAYYYNQATNYYGENNGATVVPYIRDSNLTEIDYGFTDGGAYGAVPDKVAFNSLARCVQSTCDSLSSITATQAATEYPDVPFDLYCPTASCSAPSQAPGFFSTVRLGSISTQQYSTASSTYKTVDSYVLTQTEPATHDATASTLWLNSIQRTGSDTSAGGSGTSITLPAVTFAGTDLANRVDMTNFPGLYRFRVNAITTETGSVIGVTYGTPNPCSVAYVQAQTASSASSNTNSCFPVNWTPTGYTNPVLDWFEKYAVTQVLVSDATTGALPEETDYQYTGGAAWHYDDNEVVKAKYRTYGQFRGYATVTTRTGQLANNPQTESATTYYRGMNGDWLSSSSTRSVTLTDSQGGTHVDDNALAGKPLETTGYLGDGGPVDHSTISSYWVSSAAASRTRGGLPTLIAVTSATAETWNRQALTDGGNTTWRITETDDTYDVSTSDANFGLLEYAYTHTVPVNAAYDSCAATTYAAPNTSENLVGLVASTETDSVACAGFTEGATSSAPAGLNTLTAPTTVSRPAQVESATQTFYDDATFATTFPQPSAPTVGNVTMTRKAADYTGGAFVWQTEKRATYDSYGRPLNTYDADGNETVTAYTANSVGLTTAESVALPTTGGIAHTSSTTLDPTRALTLTSTDQNGVVTTQHYDALGRLTSVWLDSRATSAAANQTYSYTVSQTGLSGVTGQKLNDESSYVTTVTIDDSLGRTRQVQAQTPQGGRLINDTFYDTHGWTYKKNNNYWDPGVTPTFQLMSVADNQVPNQDDFVFDGLGRTVEDQSKNDSRLVSTSTTVYNGDATTVIPPTGGAWKTTTTDPLGRTSQLLEYTADPALSTPSNTFTGIFSISGGTPVVTSYGYDGHGQQNTVTDSANNTWTTTYNLLGQATSKSDPDAGTSSLSYDANGNLLQSTDARGKIVSYAYDALGRKTGEYAAATTAQTAGPSGNQLAAWVYDNANNAVTGMTYPIGQQTTATSYAGGYAYTEQASGFNIFGESLGTRVIIPSGAQGTVLGKTWTFSHSYSAATGLLSGDSYPAGAGLPLESTNHTYTTALDLPNGSGSGLAGYAQTTSYTAYGQVEQATIGGLTTNQAYITDTYDPHTSKLTDQLVTRDVATPTNVDEQSYTYDLYGNITNQVSTRLGATATSETQCYQYDALDRLTTAWTATDGCATVPTTSSHAMVGDNLATASAYWTGWSIDNLGDVISETDHSTTGGADTTKAYGYNGNNANQPHTLTAASITGGTTASNSYTYDQAGNMITRATAAQGNQTLTWNAAGQVTQISNGTITSSFIYDANGNILLEQDPGSTVLYLPGEQVTLNTATQTATGARYYPLPGGAIAVRTGTGTNYYFEITNPQGTGDLYLDSTAQTPTWRQFTPYGAPRGTTTTWIDNHGFLNKPTDATTGLTIVGAREYDPTAGRFVSLDPVFESNDPQALNGYAYTDANPITQIDPTGLDPCQYAACNDSNVNGNGNGNGADNGNANGINNGSSGIKCNNYLVQQIGCSLGKDIPSNPNKGDIGNWGDFFGGLLQNVADIDQVICDVATIGLYSCHYSSDMSTSLDKAGVDTNSDAYGAGYSVIQTAAFFDGLVSGAGAADLSVRLFSPDQLVTPMAKQLNKTFPGQFVNAGTQVYRADGTMLTDLDIEMKYAVIEVKAGEDLRKLQGQLVNRTTPAAGGRPVIVYAPQLALSGQRVSNLTKLGYIIARNPQDVVAAYQRIYDQAVADSASCTAWDC